MASQLRTIEPVKMIDVASFSRNPSEALAIVQATGKHVGITVVTGESDEPSEGRIVAVLSPASDG